MSANSWDQLPASAGALLSTEECFILLDADIEQLFNNNDYDLLKTFPSATPKTEYDSYHLQDDVSTSLYPPSPPEIKPSPAELANDLLQQLDNCKQENIFSNWLEEKSELPIFENISQVPERVEPPIPVSLPIAPTYSAPQPTEDLLREFETVYGAVELTHLTPPQSPPGPATQLLLSYAQQAQCTTFAPALPLVPPQEQWPVMPAPVQVPDSVPHYDCGYEDVEELVRHRAAQLASPQHSGGSASVSPQSSPPSSPRSSCTDDEWSSSSRPKPYSRPSDDRRSRKKEQNKNAATRYRQKKKAEIEDLLNEEQQMRERNSKLSDKCSDLQREIRYLKGLMRDLYKAKGLIK
ncbi:activating transcription factor of chaperone isoform X1 [Spodoptera frugiperda]|uniref:Activating transcription factor of chaperone isoform X1 n=2 Tax=Spodoptera frugiperda TaxID=7108 RepID=A0A9R0DBE7_SPOFR|nr:activating transcription factor of chaperone isoform X1 [Spodoptera frugiperda]